MASVTDLVYIDNTGYHYSDYPSFLAFFQEGFRAIYGADVYLESDSQDGQWVALIAQANFDTAALGGSVMNSFSPASAQGVGLSRVVDINGIERITATHSTVDLAIGGTVGTTITDGVVEDELNQKWDIPSPTVIPIAGTITVTATAQELGAIEALPNTINRIFTPTRGWQTVNNPAAATTGVPVESDATLRERQAFSTANPSLTVFEGTLGAVANLTGVTNTKGYENDTNSTDADTIPAHSIAVIVLGGDSLEIAEAIALHKTPGTGTYGTTTELVHDARGMPINISFSRPILVTITVTLTIAAGDTWSSDYEPLIKTALAETINALGIGQTVLITKLYAPAYLNGTAPGQTYDVATLEIGKDTDPQSDVNIPIDYNELPECDPDVDITVIVT